MEKLCLKTSLLICRFFVELFTSNFQRVRKQPVMASVSQKEIILDNPSYYDQVYLSQKELLCVVLPKSKFTNPEIIIGNQENSKEGLLSLISSSEDNDSFRFLFECNGYVPILSLCSNCCIGTIWISDSEDNDSVASLFRLFVYGETGVVEKSRSFNIRNPQSEDVLIHPDSILEIIIYLDKSTDIDDFELYFHQLSKYDDLDMEIIGRVKNYPGLKNYINKNIVMKMSHPYYAFHNTKNEDKIPFHFWVRFKSNINKFIENNSIKNAEIGTLYLYQSSSSKDENEVQGCNDTVQINVSVDFSISSQQYLEYVTTLPTLDDLRSSPALSELVGSDTVARIGAQLSNTSKASDNKSSSDTSVSTTSLSNNVKTNEITTKKTTYTNKSIREITFKKIHFKSLESGCKVEVCLSDKKPKTSSNLHYN